MEAEWRRVSVVLMRRTSIWTISFFKGLAGNYWKYMDYFMYWCVCWQKIIHLFFKLRWPIYEMIHSIQTIHFVHKDWWKSYFMLIQRLTTFLEATLRQHSVQTNYLWYIFKRRIWGDSRPIWPRLCCRCGGWDGPTFVLHVVQPVPEGLNGISCRGQRYKVIHFLMPFKQGSQLADRRP